MNNLIKFSKTILSTTNQLAKARLIATTSRLHLKESTLLLNIFIMCKIIDTIF